VIGPAFAFIPQYNMIKSTQNVGSFSTNICLILITCNILRIFFWFGAHFEIALLFQSMIMITFQLSLLKLCVEVKFASAPPTKSEDKYTIENFWKWTNFQTYLEFLSYFTGIAGLLTLMFIRTPFFADALGFASVVIEAGLGLPQYLQNKQSKSTFGLSNVLIFSWFLGDAFKVTYFIIKSQPIQFICCGLAQLCMDILILIQIHTYTNAPSKPYEKVKGYDDRELV